MASTSLPLSQSNPNPLSENNYNIPKIIKLDISPEVLDKLRKFLECKSNSPNAKYLLQGRLVGRCSRCGDIPEFIMTKDCVVMVLN